MDETELMKTRSPGLEMKDPFLIDYKTNLQEVVNAMKSVGTSGIHLLVVEMIRSRWIRDKRTTYPFEVAWVFDKSEEGVSKILKMLEESGDVEPAGLSRGKKDVIRPYKPRTLRKVKTPGSRSRTRPKKN